MTLTLLHALEVNIDLRHVNHIRYYYYYYYYYYYQVQMNSAARLWGAD